MNALSMILCFVIIVGLAIFNNKVSSLKSEVKQKDATIKSLQRKLEEFKFK